MILKDEEEIEVIHKKNKKIKKMIILLIVLLIMLSITIGALIVYRMYNPTEITTYIDGILIEDFDKILDFQTDENGKTQIYIPIRDFASYLNIANKDFEYRTYKGDYDPKTEDDNKCYSIRDGYEVAVFSKDSKIIYKLNLQNKNEDYEECYIDKNIFENNGKLYASVDGIEQGYNVSFSYDDKKKNISIYTLDYLMTNYELDLTNKSMGEYGTMTIDTDNYANGKSIFSDLLIVKSSSNQFGIMKISDDSFILEPQYDNIQYITNSSTFLVESNGKVGLFSKDGKRKIDLIYDQISLMGRDSNLYLVTTNGQYGVVDENGTIIIYPQYERIGIDISKFSYNGVKNGYILLDELIPVSQNSKWAFFNTKGEQITDGFKYTNIGCTSIRTENNVYGLLQIPEKKVIVVGNSNKKYSFMDTSGNDSILPFVFDAIYIRMSSGNTSYYMTSKDKEYEVLKYLK